MEVTPIGTMGTAKVSLGLLLLRLVTKRWHRWAIWTAISLLFVDTAVCAFAFAFQCTPPAYLWDKTITTGRCPLPIAPFAIALGAGCVASDRKQLGGGAGVLCGVRTIGGGGMPGYKPSSWPRVSRCHGADESELSLRGRSLSRTERITCINAKDVKVNAG
ncbi:uncharacterized protein PG986_014035 [Apiospora aurea]|uniref:Rhodopsin domain-containing protein n=1 Tax=Apiospora aurea TaxID=335848 RepID=A0ABR1PXL8_9PEZI